MKPQYGFSFESNLPKRCKSAILPSSSQSVLILLPSNVAGLGQINLEKFSTGLDISYNNTKSNWLVKQENVHGGVSAFPGTQLTEDRFLTTNLEQIQNSAS